MRIDWMPDMWDTVRVEGASVGEDAESEAKLVTVRVEGALVGEDAESLAERVTVLAEEASSGEDSESEGERAMVLAEGASGVRDVDGEAVCAVGASVSTVREDSSNGVVERSGCTSPCVSSSWCSR